MPADRDGAEGIVDTEAPGRGNMRVERQHSLRIKGDPQLTGCVDQLDIFRAQIIAHPKAESLHRTGMTLQDPCAVRVISVENAGPALAEKKALTVKVIFKISVLIGADMIRGKVCKNPQVKNESCGPVKHQGLGGDLHDDCLHTAVRHLAEASL